MDRSVPYMNVKLGKTESPSPSQAEPDVSYAELNFKTRSALRVRTDRDCPNSTSTELNFQKEETRIDKDEEPPTSSGQGRLPTIAQTGPHTEESKRSIGNRLNRALCLLCLVTLVLVAIVVGISIHVLQIRQSQSNSDHDFQILCQSLTSKGEQACSHDWVRNNDRCYFISTLETSYEGANNNCSKIGARLMEINSTEEKVYVTPRETMCASTANSLDQAQCEDPSTPSHHTMPNSDTE